MLELKLYIPEKVDKLVSRFKINTNHFNDLLKLEKLIESKNITKDDIELILKCLKKVE